MRWWISARAHRRDMQATDGHGARPSLDFSLIRMRVRVWECERQLLLNAIQAWRKIVSKLFHIENDLVKNATVSTVYSNGR